MFPFTCDDIDVVIETILSANHLNAFGEFVHQAVVSANISPDNFDIEEEDFFE